MIRFKHYPIYINYNIFTKEERSQALFARRARFYSSYEGLQYTREQEEYRALHGEVYDWIEDTMPVAVEQEDQRLDEIKPGDSSPEAIQFEVEIWRALITILTTPIGRTLFDLMVPTEKIWIVMDQGDGPGVARTTPGILRKEIGGGVRLNFNPWGGFDYVSESYTMDDILFHELVHAYRSAKLDMAGTNWTKLNGYQTAEEFLAIHMQNMYLSFRGKRKYYFTHDEPKLVTKGEAYVNITADAGVVRAFKDYLKNEPLAQTLSAWQSPDYNPWCDLQLIQ